MDLGFRAARGLDGGTRRAALGLRAGDNGATRARARRTLPNLTGFVARADTRGACRNSRFENIARHVGGSRAIRLEHVAAQVGLRRARRD